MKNIIKRKNMNKVNESFSNLSHLKFFKDKNGNHIINLLELIEYSKSQLVTVHDIHRFNKNKK